jgi:methylmalonyl-CoA/ethylmalonyl-CoA epimerase
MIVDHIGIAVRSLEEGIKHWENIFGYRQATDVVTNTRQKVRVVFMKKSNSIDIKLIEPTEEASPVYSFCQKGGGLHHLCFKCEDMKIELDLMKTKGLRILAPPQPGEAFENENIAFVFAKHGLNIELIDTNKRAGIKG